MAKIVIDPGHYGDYNAGVCTGYYESGAMLTLGQYLAEALTAMGADVTMTRTTPAENPSLAERGQMAANADLFISLHSDAADDPSARGVTVYNSVKRPQSEPLAAEIGSVVADVMGNQFRGVVARPSTNDPNVDYLGVLRSAAAAGAKNAMLVEHGFHTNPEDCAFLSNDENLRRIADAEAQVIGAYFGLSAQPAPPSPPQIPECGFYYIVQPGETLFIIGKKFGVPWQMIAEANNIYPPYTIIPGQRLLIPPSGR